MGTAATDATAVELLNRVPELEQLAYSVQAKIEDGMFPEETTLPLRVVHIYTAAGFPYYRRFGGRMEAVKISTAVALKKKANAVAVRGKEAAGEQQVQGMETDQQGQPASAQQTEWYCDVLAFVVLQYANGHRSKPLAFVRWYQREESQDIDPRIAMLKMTPLKVERDQRRVPEDQQRTRTVDFTDLVEVHDILRPVFIQPNPLRQGRTKGFLYNPFVP